MWKLIVHAIFAFFTVIPTIALLTERTTRSPDPAIFVILGLFVIGWIVFAIITHTPSEASIQRKLELQELEAEKAAAEEPPPPAGKMRVTLETRQQKRPAATGSGAEIVEYIVHLKVRVSEEARAILNAHNLWETVLLAHPHYMAPDELKAYPESATEMAGEMVPFTVKDFLRASGFQQRFATIIEAKAFENQLREETLPFLKRLVEQTKEASADLSPQTFDL